MTRARGGVCSEGWCEIQSKKRGQEAARCVVCTAVHDKKRTARYGSGEIEAFFSRWGVIEISFRLHAVRESRVVVIVEYSILQLEQKDWPREDRICAFHRQHARVHFSFTL